MIALRNAALIAILSIGSSAFGWNASGHMVIADIAQRNLRAEVNLECMRLLRSDPTAQVDFMTAGPWADAIRSSRPETGPWHYINLHFRTDGKPTTSKPDPENVLTAIAQQSAILRDRSLPDAQRAEALRFLIHFVGDIHQPLHAVARDTDAHPGGDRGGNDFKIGAAPEFQQARPPANLHALWDMGGGLFPNLELPLNPLSRLLVQTQAATLIATVPPPRRIGNPTSWANENLETSRKYVYSTPEGAIPDRAYLADVRRISARQAAFAGYRLASLLNSLLG